MLTQSATVNPTAAIGIPGENADSAVWASGDGNVCMMAYDGSMAWPAPTFRRTLVMATVLNDWYFAASAVSVRSVGLRVDAVVQFVLKYPRSASQLDEACMTNVQPPPLVVMSQ